jgi:hypothetical protein
MRATQFRSLVSCPTEINFVDKDGTSKVFVRVRVLEIGTSPAPFTGYSIPFAFRISFLSLNKDLAN